MKHLVIRYAAMLLLAGAHAFSVNAGDQHVPWNAVPPGYRIPTEPDIEADFRRPHPTGYLRMAERNKVYHFVQMDQSPRNWADNVLRIVVGFAEHWTPKDYYAVLPEGYREEPGRAVVFMSTKKIKFGTKLDPDAVEPLRSTSDPQYTLTRMGEHLVLTRGADRRWYFETPDQGKSWRIAMIEEVQRPGRFTRMEYLNDLIVAVKYPNGQEATIDYEFSRPVRITTPFGQRAEIHRATGGYITKVEIFRDAEGFDPGPAGRWVEGNPKANHVRSKQPVEVHHYERDAEGRVSRYRDTCGNALRVDYRVDQSTETKLDKVVYVARITNEGDGSYLERTHETRPKLKEWFIKDRYGREGEKTGEDTLANAVRLTEVNKRWTVVGQAHGDEGRETNIKVDKRGLPTTSVGPTGLTKVTEHDEAGNQVKVVESDGRANVSTYNEFGQVTRRVDSQGRETLTSYDELGRRLIQIDSSGRETAYEYGTQGFPAATEYRGKRYTYEIDDWGRLTGVDFGNGTALNWAFNRYGDIESTTQLPPTPLGELLTAGTNAGKVTTYLRDDRGRIVSIEYPDGTADQVAYTPEGRLHAVIESDGNRIGYRYDKAGRISHKSDPKRRFEMWTYHPNGRIEVYRFRDQDHKGWTERKHDREGKLVYERASGEPPLENQYNVLGQLVRTDYPDGTWSTFSYDARGQVISVRGTHQDPVDYRYEDGRRVTVPPPATQNTKGAAP